MWQRWRIQIWLVVAAASPVVFSLAWYFFAMDDDGEDVVPSPFAEHVPRLVVVLVFDQMRGDYLGKWQNLFAEGGFKRLQGEGAWFTNCHYPYSDTFTAPGHASLLTGCTPRDHGIVANQWYDRKKGILVHAWDGERGHGPTRRLKPTVGDVLLTRSRGRSKVASLSIKERSAILLAALRAQICYWLTGKNFSTSRHYPQDHRWVTRFNASKKLDNWLGSDWLHLHPDLDYARYSGPDDVSYEGDGFNQGRAFPHPIETPDALTNSPFGNDLLLAFARTAIDAEKLGQRDVPDLLCLSFSSNDLVGHCYGPDSQEVLDITLRSDLVVKELLTFLDDRVGQGKYVVALSADHGVCPIPEVARQKRKDAGYVEPTLLTTKVEEFLNEKFGKGGMWIEDRSSSNHWVYLNQAHLRARRLQPSQVERALADWLAKQPNVQAAFTRTELATDQVAADPLAERVRQTFHPECSGDVAVILKPYYLLETPPKKARTGSYAATHGSPHDYDTWVPLLVMGPGIKPGTYTQPVAPQAMASILSHVLEIDPPSGARYPPPDDVYLSPSP